MKRRTVLALPGLGLLGACSDGGGPVGGPTGTPTASPRITPYGEDASQFGELHLPDGEPRGVVVVIHGGFWLAQYDLSLGVPLATSLAEQGWAAWNLEYRRRRRCRIGGGGGDPATFDDIAAGIEKLADLDVPLDTVITVGHSAGGHLATWAASRGRDDRWAAEVEVTAVVSQAGVLDLRAAHAAGLGGGAVARFLGHAPGPADAILDPIQQVPLDVPVYCVHGTDDDIVPISQSQAYVDAATAAGATAELVQVDGDHFVVIDPASEAWAKTLAVLDRLG